MSRLTGYDADGGLIVCEEERLLCSNGTITKDEMYKIMRHLAEKLAEYEDLEEQRKLPKLPCAVGDTVYEICEGFIEPCTVEVIFLGDYKDKDGNQSYMMEIHYDREDCPWVSTEVYFTDIGKTVFLTKSEAESALQQMGN